MNRMYKKKNVSARQARHKRRKNRCLDKKRIDRDVYLFAAMLTIALLYVGIYYVKQVEADRQYRSLKERSAVPTVYNIQDLVPERDEDPEPGADMEEIEAALQLRKVNMIDFEELWKVNEDIYAWIEVPGTDVNYPVLQHPTEDDYYLEHTMEHVAGRPGSIYSEAIHPKDFSAANTILYGHNMSNGTMFASLHRYEDRAFLKEYPYIYLYLPERTLLYQVFAATMFSDVYLPYYCDFEEESARASYVEEIRNLALCQDDCVTIEPSDRLLTLSTCMANDDPKHRFLVEAVLIDEYER